MRKAADPLRLRHLKWGAGGLEGKAPAARPPPARVRGGRGSPRTYPQPLSKGQRAQQGTSYRSLQGGKKKKKRKVKENLVWFSRKEKKEKKKPKTKTNVTS